MTCPLVERVCPGAGNLSICPIAEEVLQVVRRDPLRWVHECVFGVLALESEAVDPRL